MVVEPRSPDGMPAKGKFEEVDMRTCMVPRMTSATRLSQRNKKSYDMRSLPSASESAGWVEALPRWQHYGAFYSTEPIWVVHPTLRPDIPRIALRRLHEMGFAMRVEMCHVILGRSLDTSRYCFGPIQWQMWRHANWAHLSSCEVGEYGERS